MLRHEGGQGDRNDSGDSDRGVGPARPDIAGSPRTVVKVGSSSLTTKNGAIDDARIAALTDAISARTQSGHQVLLVSSGAIATGMAPLGLSGHTKSLQDLFTDRRIPRAERAN